MTQDVTTPAFGPDHGTTSRHGQDPRVSADPGGRDRPSQTRPRAPRAALSQLERARERRETLERAREQAHRIGLTWPPPEHREAPEPGPAPELTRTHRADGEERVNPWLPARVQHRRNQQGRLADAYRLAGLVELAEDVRRCGRPRALALRERQPEPAPPSAERPLGELLALELEEEGRRAALERELDEAGVPEELREPKRAALERLLENGRHPLPLPELPTWPPELGEPPRDLLDELDRRGLVLVLSRRASEGGAPRALRYACGQRHCVEGCGSEHAAHARSRVLERVRALRPPTDDEGQPLELLGDALGDLRVVRPGHGDDVGRIPAERRARIEKLRVEALAELARSPWPTARRLEATTAYARRLVHTGARGLVVECEHRDRLGRLLYRSPRLEVTTGVRVVTSGSTATRDPGALELAAELERPTNLREAERLVTERTGLAPRQRRPTYLVETARLESQIERAWHRELKREHGPEHKPSEDDLDELELRLAFARAARGRAYGGRLRLHHHDNTAWEWERLHLLDDEAQLLTFTRPDLEGEPAELGIWHLQRALALWWQHDEVTRRTYAHTQSVEPEWSSPATRQARVTRLCEEADDLEQQARALLEVWDHEGADRLLARAAKVRAGAAELSQRGRLDHASRWHTHAHVVAWVHGSFWSQHRALRVWRECVRQAYLDGVEHLRERAAWLLGVGLAADNRAAHDDADEARRLAAARAERLRLQARAEVRRTGGTPRARGLARVLRAMASLLEQEGDEQAQELAARLETTTTKAQRKEAARGLLALAERWAEQAEREGAGGLNFRPRRRNERVEERIAEAVKYATKTMGSKHTQMPLSALADLVAATRGKRLLKCGGLLYGVKLEEEHEPSVTLEGGAVEVREHDGERLEVWGYTPDGLPVFEDELYWLDGSDWLADAVRVEALRQGWERAASRRRDELTHRRGPAPPRRRRG